MFIIIEYKYNDSQIKSNILSFNSEKKIIEFISGNSIGFEEFEILRINEYIEGNLIPKELKLIKGRIKLCDVGVINE